METEWVTCRKETDMWQFPTAEGGKTLDHQHGIIFSNHYEYSEAHMVWIFVSIVALRYTYKSNHFVNTPNGQKMETIKPWTG
jgi:hypothetical protein